MFEEGRKKVQGYQGRATKRVTGGAMRQDGGAHACQGRHSATQPAVCMQVLGDELQEELLAGTVRIRSRLACLRHDFEEEGQGCRVVLPGPQIPLTVGIEVISLIYISATLAPNSELFILLFISPIRLEGRTQSCLVTFFFGNLHAFSLAVPAASTVFSIVTLRIEQERCIHSHAVTF